MNDIVEGILKEVLDVVGVPYTQITRNEIAGQIIYSIESPEGGNTLIGNHSDAVHALDHLVKKIIEKKVAAARESRIESDNSSAPELEHRGMFLIDVNDHRTQQIRDLQSKALMMAERARSLEYDVELSPMSAYERLIIHTTLQDAPNVKTESQGEGHTRRVVIKYSAPLES